MNSQLKIVSETGIIKSRKSLFYFELFLFHYNPDEYDHSFRECVFSAVALERIGKIKFARIECCFLWL